MGALEEKKEDALESVPVTMADLEQFAEDRLTVMILNGDGKKHPKPIGEAVEILFDELGWLRDVGKGYRLVKKYKWALIIGGVLTYQFIAANGLGLFEDLNIFDIIKSISGS